LLLAQVRLTQNEPALVVSDLRRFVAAGPRAEFRGPANGLLGAALEETGQFADAVKAYEAAVEATPYSGIKAQYLLDAARSAHTAGDTTLAARFYERIAADFSGTPSAVEAEVRLGELRKTGLTPGKTS
jgi:TolA-binding protein